VAFLLFGITDELNYCCNTWSQAWGGRVKRVRPQANWKFVAIWLLRN